MLVSMLFLTVLLTQCRPKQYSREKHNTDWSKKSVCRLIFFSTEERMEILCVAGCCVKYFNVMLAILALCQEKSTRFSFLLRMKITA